LFQAFGFEDFPGQPRILDASAQPQDQAQHQQRAEYPQLIFLDAANMPSSTAPKWYAAAARAVAQIAAPMPLSNR